MIFLETAKAGLTKADFDILDYLEYPKTLEQISNEFPNIKIEGKLADLIAKSLVIEKDLKYMTRFFTQSMQTMVDNSRLPEDIKENFKIILSKMDIPIIRYTVYDYETRKKIEFLLKMMMKTNHFSLVVKELTTLRMYMLDLMERVR